MAVSFLSLAGCFSRLAHPASPGFSLPLGAWAGVCFTQRLFGRDDRLPCLFFFARGLKRVRRPRFVVCRPLCLDVGTCLSLLLPYRPAAFFFFLGGAQVVGVPRRQGAEGGCGDRPRPGFFFFFF